METAKLADPAVLVKIGKAFASEKDRYPGKLAPAANLDFDKHTVLTKTVTITFFPNSYDLFKKVPDPKKPRKVLHDPNIEKTLAEIAVLAARFPSARIEIGGHTDTSMKGVADESLVVELSSSRAKAMRDALIAKHKIDPEQLVAKGFGWSRPRTDASANDHAKHRRVEIRVHAVQAATASPTTPALPPPSGTTPPRRPTIQPPAGPTAPTKP